MRKNLSKEVINDINSGLRQTSNLMEFLAADFQLLLKNTIPEFIYPQTALSVGVVERHNIIANALDNQFGFAIFKKLENHESDILRGLACYLIDKQNLAFEEKIQLITHLADDVNSGVREWAWLAIRKSFISDLHKNIEIIAPLSLDKRVNIRRFVSELSRPRGVWCRHINEIKVFPELGLKIIEPLKSDPVKYVQLSVGNWLNDAGKDNPEWVINLCSRWRKESSTIETEKICKRGLRNL